MLNIVDCVSMSLRSQVAGLIASLAIGACLWAQEAKPKRAITDKDLFAFVWLADPQLRLTVNGWRSRE